MPIPFIDLKAQYRRIQDTVHRNIEAVLEHGRYIMGPEVEALEARLAAYAGARLAVGCGSGTDALLMALMALNVGPGDAVFTTSFTFMATAEAPALLGATPVFVDIDRATFNLDPAALGRAIRAVKDNDRGLHPLPRVGGLAPKAVVAVDLFGLPADYLAIEAACQAHGLALIEDGAQSFGAEYMGRRACSFGRVACTSFFPAKPLGCYGDGGMCFSNDSDLDALLRSIRVHGQGRDKYENVRLGLNARLDTIQAAVVLAKMEVFDQELELRQQVARRYNELLSGAESLVLPRVPEGSVSAWAQYTLLAESEAHRARLIEALAARGVPTALYYPRPLHLQAAFAGLGYVRGELPVCEEFSARVFSLPMHPYLDPEDQERAASAILAA